MKKPPPLGKLKTPEAYQQAQWVTEGLLIGAAQARRVVTYKEVIEVVLAATGHLVYGQFSGRLLEDLDRRTYPRYGVLLSALVLNSKTLAPGKGFTDLAHELGLVKPGETEMQLDHRLRAEVFKRFAR